MDYVQYPGQPRRALADLGLGTALATWRPFLPYAELGGLLDNGPSKLYDAISAALGLDGWLMVEERVLTPGGLWKQLSRR